MSGQGSFDEAPPPAQAMAGLPSSLGIEIPSDTTDSVGAVPLHFASHSQLAAELYSYCGDSWNDRAWSEYMASKSVFELRSLVATFRGGRWLKSGGWCGDQVEGGLNGS